jgi:nitronate monooxygenase
MPTELLDRLRLPVVAAPMFLVSTVELVAAQCRAGVLGTMPTLNIREPERLAGELRRLRRLLAEHDVANPGAPAAPFGVNLVVKRGNPRFEHDLAVCVAERVPLVITSLGAARDVVDAVHGYGGSVFHDVTNLQHAKKAIEAGVDGIVAVAVGAGGHAGRLHPFALCRDIRRIFEGPIALAGAISTGADILAAQAAGADLAHIGTRFIATHEANADAAYKRMVIESRAEDIVYTPFFSGIPANYLRASIAATGLDPDDLAGVVRGAAPASHEAKKVWRDVWSAGHGVGAAGAVFSVEETVAQIAAEYAAAARRLFRLRFAVDALASA